MSAIELDPLRVRRVFYSFECFVSLPPTGSLDSRVPFRWSEELDEEK
jgi:hypothetical protein